MRLGSRRSDPSLDEAAEEWAKETGPPERRLPLEEVAEVWANKSAVPMARLLRLLTNERDARPR